MHRTASKYGLPYTEEEDRVFCKYIVEKGVHGQWVPKEWFEENVEGKLSDLHGRVGSSLYSRYTSHLRQQLSKHLAKAQAGDFTWIKATSARFKWRLYSYEEDWALCEVVARNGLVGCKVGQKWFQDHVVKSKSPKVLHERSSGSLYGRFTGTLMHSLDADCSQQADGKPLYIWLRRLHGMPDAYQPDMSGIEIPHFPQSARGLQVTGRPLTVDKAVRKIGGTSKASKEKAKPQELGIGKRVRTRKKIHDPYDSYDNADSNKKRRGPKPGAAKKRKTTASKRKAKANNSIPEEHESSDGSNSYGNDLTETPVPRKRAASSSASESNRSGKRAAPTLHDAMPYLKSANERYRQYFDASGPPRVVKEVYIRVSPPRDAVASTSRLDILASFAETCIKEGAY